MSFDLKQIAALLLKRWLILLLAALLCAGLFYAYAALYVTPVYASSTTMMISTQGGTAIGLTNASSFIPTYSALLKNATVLEETAASLGLEEDVKYSPGALAGMITVSSVNETGIFYITVTCANPEHAPIIANKVAEVALPYVVSLADGNAVRQISDAEGAWKVSPNEGRNAFYGFLIGAGLAAAVLILLELLDTAIKSEDDLKEVAAGVPIIGIIPSVEIPVSTGIRVEKRTN